MTTALPLAVYNLTALQKRENFGIHMRIVMLFPQVPEVFYISRKNKELVYFRVSQMHIFT